MLAVGVVCLRGVIWPRWWRAPAIHFNGAEVNGWRLENGGGVELILQQSPELKLLFPL